MQENESSETRRRQNKNRKYSENVRDIGRESLFALKETLEELLTRVNAVKIVIISLKLGDDLEGLVAERLQILLCKRA